MIDFESDGPQHPKEIAELQARLSGVVDEAVRSFVEKLYTDHEALHRRYENNLRLISSLKSQTAVDQERIKKLRESRLIIMTLISGCTIILGAVALLMATLPAVGYAAAVFLVVLLGRVCLPFSRQALVYASERLFAH